MTKDYEILQQILQRVVRIETRMIQLGDKLGVNLKGGGAPVPVYNIEAKTVDIGAVDTALSSIINCAYTAGVREDWVEVFYRDERVGEVYVGEL